MVDEVSKEFRVEHQLVVGSQGIFDVQIDDQLVFSKAEENRFPEPGEILQRIKMLSS